MHLYQIKGHINTIMNIFPIKSIKTDHTYEKNKRKESKFFILLHQILIMSYPWLK